MRKLIFVILLILLGVSFLQVKENVPEAIAQERMWALAGPDTIAAKGVTSGATPAIPIKRRDEVVYSFAIIDSAGGVAVTFTLQGKVNPGGWFVCTPDTASRTVAAVGTFGQVFTTVAGLDSIRFYSASITTGDTLIVYSNRVKKEY
jgi:hypothetical protein